MKKRLILTIFVCFFFSLSVFAQEEKDDKPSTKLEEFLSKKGELIIKDFYYLGETPGAYGSYIKFQALVIYEPGQEEGKTKGLAIEINSGGKYERSDTSFLDLEEIESLSKAITYMIDLSGKWRKVEKEYTEVVFSTKGGFRIGFFQKGLKNQAVASCGHVAKTTCYFSIEALPDVKLKVDEGFEILNKN